MRETCQLFNSPARMNQKFIIFLNFIFYWITILKLQSYISKFKYGRLNKYIYGGAHDAIIGEWIRWWITDTIKGKKGIIHSIINPAMEAKYRGQKYHADVLFAEHVEKKDKGPDVNGIKRDFFRIVGVAEIENNNRIETLKRKVNSLYAYEKCRDKNRRIKFPDLDFTILCTYYLEDSNKQHEVSVIINYIKTISKKSKLKWVFYVLNKAHIDEDYFFRVTGYAVDSMRKSFYYGRSFFGKTRYYIIYRGKEQH